MATTAQRLPSRAMVCRSAEAAEPPLRHRPVSAEVLEMNGSSTLPQPARLVFMGERRAGTSSLLKRFNLGLFSEDYRPEIAKVMRHTKDVLHPRYGCYVTVQFWDIEGSERRTAMQCAHAAHAVCVIYDITNRSSFERAQAYLQSVKPKVSVLLLANKVDLAGQRKVSFEEGRLLAKIHRVHYVETSAKCNYNVDEAFQIMIESVPDEYLIGTPTETLTQSKQSTSAKVCVLCSTKMRHHADRNGNSVSLRQRAHSDGEPSGHRHEKPGFHRMLQTKLPTSSYHIGRERNVSM